MPPYSQASFDEAMKTAFAILGTAIFIAVVCSIIGV